MSGIPREERTRDYLFHYKNQKQRYIDSYNKTLGLFKARPQEIDVATRFGRAHVLCQGDLDKPVLVLLHGMDASSTMWYPNMDAWSKT
ncbi:MAG: alpha/beta hydrolase, partial [Chitinophagaceae bacterium]